MWPPRPAAPWSSSHATGQQERFTQLAGTHGCVSETGTGGTCADGTALVAPYVAVSPDGKNLYFPVLV